MQVNQYFHDSVVMLIRSLMNQYNIDQRIQGIIIDVLTNPSNNLYNQYMVELHNHIMRNVPMGSDVSSLHQQQLAPIVGSWLQQKITNLTRILNNQNQGGGGGIGGGTVALGNTGGGGTAVADTSLFTGRPNPSTLAPAAAEPLPRVQAPAPVVSQLKVAHMSLAFRKKNLEGIQMAENISVVTGLECDTPGTTGAGENIRLNGAILRTNITSDSPARVVRTLDRLLPADLKRGLFAHVVSYEHIEALQHPTAQYLEIYNSLREKKTLSTSGWIGLIEQIGNQTNKSVFSIFEAAIVRRINALLSRRLRGSDMQGFQIGNFEDLTEICAPEFDFPPLTDDSSYGRVLEELIVEAFCDYVHHEVVITPDEERRGVILAVDDIVVPSMTVDKFGIGSRDPEIVQGIFDAIFSRYTVLGTTRHLIYTNMVEEEQLVSGEQIFQNRTNSMLFNVIAGMEKIWNSTAKVNPGQIETVFAIKPKTKAAETIREFELVRSLDGKFGLLPAAHKLGW